MERAPTNDSAAEPKTMARPRRWRRWLLATLTLLALGWLLLGPWPLAWVEDLTPQVDLRLRSQTTLNAPEPLRVGAAAVRLAFNRPLPLAGYGSRAFKANSVAGDDLFVRVVVLERGGKRVAVATADLLLVNRAIVEAVRERLDHWRNGWEIDQVYFGATHTHSAPGGYPGRLAEMVAIGWSDNAVVAEIANAFVGALKQAVEHLTGPCEFGHFAVETSGDLIRNRTVPTDSTNRWLDLLAFRTSSDKKAVAVVAIYSAHATCASPSDPRISGDYPGLLVKKLEAALHCPTAFLAGAVGSMGPGEVAGDRALRSDWLASQLADAAQTAFAQPAIYDGAPAIALESYDFALPTPAIKLARSWAVSPLAARWVLPGSTTLAVLRLGSCTLIGTPCDYNGSLALELRATAKTNGAPTPIVTSFAGDYIGYTVPERYFDLTKYEPRSMAFHGRRFGEELSNAIAAMLAKSR